MIPSIIVTHDMRDITGIGDGVCLLGNGKIATKGKADEFLAKKDDSSGIPDDLGTESHGNAWKLPESN